MAPSRSMSVSEIANPRFRSRSDRISVVSGRAGSTASAQRSEAVGAIGRLFGDGTDKAVSRPRNGFDVLALVSTVSERLAKT